MDKKKLIIIVVVVVLLLLVVVYAMLKRGGGNDDGGTSGPVELTYWGLWEPTEVMEEIIAEYESDNPNITINYTQKRFTQYEDNLYSALDDPQTTPDIVRINNAWTYKFQSKLSRLPPEVMSLAEYEDTFYPSATEDFMGSDGYLYAIPLETDGLALYWNKDLFDQAGITEPPTDWETLIEDAVALTETDHSGEITQAGVALGCATNVNHSADILTALMLLNGVPMNNSEGTEASFNTDEGEIALDYYTSFVETYGVWDCSLRSDLEMFSSNTLAMMFAPSWRVFDIIDRNSTVNFDTAPFPQLPGNAEPTYFGMYWGEAVSLTSSYQLEAWNFIRYLSESEQQQRLYAAQSDIRAFGEPYSRVDLAEEIAGAAYVGPFIEMAPYYVSWRIGDQKTSEAALNKAIGDVVEGRNTSSAALEEAITTINEANEELYGGGTGTD